MPEFESQYVNKIEGLDRFTWDYLTAIEWLLEDAPKGVTVTGFSPVAIDIASADCATFQQVHAADLADYANATARTGGADLWLTRNGHGAGFWDRGLGALGNRLSAGAKAIGGKEAYISIDGFICLY